MPIVASASTPVRASATFLRWTRRDPLVAGQRGVVVVGLIGGGFRAVVRGGSWRLAAAAVLGLAFSVGTLDQSHSHWARRRNSRTGEPDDLRLDDGGPSPAVLSASSQAPPGC